ncbi:hypothetical protein [Nevskia ramosa]|uniref:hypothetical protein n=1 Tax=Nevskia ramosa TaxID=64002 RepID=UPI003D0BAC37
MTVAHYAIERAHARSLARAVRLAMRLRARFSLMSDGSIVVMAATRLSGGTAAFLEHHGRTLMAHPDSRRVANHGMPEMMGL